MDDFASEVKLLLITIMDCKTLGHKLLADPGSRPVPHSSVLWREEGNSTFRRKKETLLTSGFGVLLVFFFFF